MADDFAHTGFAEQRRREKALALAKFSWDRGIVGSELLAMPQQRRRKLARAAGVAPGSDETWQMVAELLDEKTSWAAAHPGHPAATPAYADEKILWIPPTPRRR